MQEAQERIDFIKKELSNVLDSRHFEMTDTVYALLELAKQVAINQHENDRAFFREAAQEVIEFYLE